MADELRFSFQKHDNVDFNYILKLEVEGQVRSFAVPKGPSPDPRVKRLAIPIEDDTDLGFEGVIDRDDRSEKVIVWDSGTYTTTVLDGEQLPPAESLDNGKLDFWLEGQKLEGGFTLLRIEDGKNERWLLMKQSDKKATGRRDPVNTEPLSVVSGRKVEDVDE